MNSRSLLVTFIAVGLAATVSYWLWSTPAAPAKKPGARVHPPVGLRSEEPENFPPLPDGVAATPAPQLTPAPTIDPQTELGTAIQDFARLAQSGDVVTLMQNYMPPDEQARMGPDAMSQLQEMMKSPAGAIMTQMMLNDIQAIQNATPTYDETGNRATFVLPPGSSESKAVFVRVNGRWYRE